MNPPIANALTRTDTFSYGLCAAAIFPLIPIGYIGNTACYLHFIIRIIIYIKRTSLNLNRTGLRLQLNPFCGILNNPPVILYICLGLTRNGHNCGSKHQVLRKHQLFNDLLLLTLGIGLFLLL